MIQNRFLIIILLPLLFSCYQENKVDVKKPDPLLTREKMVEILTDIQMAEGIISYGRTARKNYNNDYKDSLYQRLFDHYHISSTTLKENIAYYNIDPSVMEDIYEDVLENLSKTQSEILMDTIKKKEILNDSLEE